MILYYIRHAQSENNALVLRTGSSQGRYEDPALSEVGLMQAECLAEYLRTANPVAAFGDQPECGFGITHLYTSLMLRATQTAHIVANELELPVTGRLDLFETGGVYLDDEASGLPVGQPGKPRSFFNVEFPRLILPETVGEEGWYNRPYEARAERLPRAQRLVADLLATHRGSQDRVALFSHGSFFNDFMRAMLGVEAQVLPWFEMANAAITRFDFTERGVRVAYQNRVDHLPVEIITA